MGPPKMLLLVLATIIASTVRVGAFVFAWVIALGVADHFTWNEWSELVFTGLLAYGLSDVVYNGIMAQLERRMHEREEAKINQAMEALLIGLKNAGSSGTNTNKTMVH